MGWGDWVLQYPRAFTTGNGYDSPDKMVGIRMGDNKILEGNQLKSKNGLFWQSINFYRQAYKMGILDPESFTQKYDAYQAKENAGQYMYINPGWEYGGINNQFIKDKTPQKGFAMLPAFGTDRQILISVNAIGERQIAISAKTKYPAKCLELIDYLSSKDFSRIAINGVKGVYWDTVNGKPVAKKGLYDVKVTPEQRTLKSGMGVYGHFMGYCNGTRDDNGLPLSLGYLPEVEQATMTDVNKDVLKHYGAKSLHDVYTKNLKYYESIGLLGLGDIPANLVTYETNLNNYVFKNEFKLMIEKNDKSFAKLQNDFIKGLDAFKADTLYNFWLKKAKEVNAENKPMLEAYQKAK